MKGFNGADSGSDTRGRQTSQHRVRFIGKVGTSCHKQMLARKTNCSDHVDCGDEFAQGETRNGSIQDNWVVLFLSVFFELNLSLALASQRGGRVHGGAPRRSASLRLPTSDFS